MKNTRGSFTVSGRKPYSSREMGLRKLRDCPLVRPLLLDCSCAYAAAACCCLPHPITHHREPLTRSVGDRSVLSPAIGSANALVGWILGPIERYSNQNVAILEGSQVLASTRGEGQGGVRKHQQQPQPSQEEAPQEAPR